MRALPHKHWLCAVLFPRFLKVFARLCFVLLFSQLCFACFASQTSGLCSAFPSVPKVFCPLVFVLLFSKFCYACFSSQTSGLCSAFPSLPVIFWQACFVLSSKFYYACFASQTTVCAVKYFLIPSAPCSLVFVRLFFPLVLFSEVFSYVCLASRSPVFVAGPFDLRAFLALCYFVLVACLPKFPAPIFRFSLLPRWAEGVSYALVPGGLLTLRLPSLGWGYLAYPLPLKFVLLSSDLHSQFAFLLPFKGWQPLNVLLMSSFLYSQNDPLAKLLARVRSLEGANNATASHYLKIAQVLRPGGPSELLSRNVSSAQPLVASYSDFNSLSNFTVAFPAGPSP